VVGGVHGVCEQENRARGAAIRRVIDLGARQARHRAGDLRSPIILIMPLEDNDVSTRPGQYSYDRLDSRLPGCLSGRLAATLQPAPPFNSQRNPAMSSAGAASRAANSVSGACVPLRTLPWLPGPPPAVDPKREW